MIYMILKLVFRRDRTKYFKTSVAREACDEVLYNKAVVNKYISYECVCVEDGQE